VVLQPLLKRNDESENARRGAWHDSNYLSPTNVQTTLFLQIGTEGHGLL